MYSSCVELAGFHRPSKGPWRHGKISVELLARSKNGRDSISVLPSSPRRQACTRGAHPATASSPVQPAVELLDRASDSPRRDRMADVIRPSPATPVLWSTRQSVLREDATALALDASGDDVELPQRRNGAVNHRFGSQALAHFQRDARVASRRRRAPYRSVSALRSPERYPETATGRVGLRAPAAACREHGSPVCCDSARMIESVGQGLRIDRVGACQRPMLQQRRAFPQRRRSRRFDEVQTPASKQRAGNLTTARV